MRIQAILTELLFHHALRIRVKSETAEDGAGTPDSDGTRSEAKTGVDKDVHLVGKLNNLVTTDIENIKHGNKFWLQLRESRLSRATQNAGISWRRSHVCSRQSPCTDPLFDRLHVQHSWMEVRSSCVLVHGCPSPHY